MAYLVEALARHEVHVARYYLARGAYLAAANRAQDAISFAHPILDIRSKPTPWDESFATTNSPREDPPDPRASRLTHGLVMEFWQPTTAWAWRSCATTPRKCWRRISPPTPKSHSYQRPDALRELVEVLVI